MLRKRFIKSASAILLAGTTTVVLAQSVDQRIRLNTVGFRPGHPKIASISSNAVDTPRVLIMPIGSSQAVARANMSQVTNIDTGNEELWIADFSHFNTPGQYQLNVVGLGISPTFTISDDIFHETYRTAMLAMYLWRCGNPGGVEATFGGQLYKHGACHLGDGMIHSASGLPNAGTRKDGTGGWHDAGDYNKYVVNSGVTIGLMLKAWENYYGVIENIPLHVIQNSGNLPAYLVEVKWNIDWVAKMQFEDGWVSHKLTTLSFGGNILPETETDTRYFIMAGTKATAAFAGIMAQAARIYAPYIPDVAAGWLEQAKRAYDVVMESPFITTTGNNDCSNNTNPPGNPACTGGYEANNDQSQRQWAAAELWETTGDLRYLEDLETRASSSSITPSHVIINTEWAQVQNLATMTYINSHRPGRRETLVDSIRDAMITRANTIVENTQTHGYGRPMGRSYVWGANGAVASTAYILTQAYRFTGEQKYRDAMHAALDHLLGRNYQARSFVTRVGHNPPVNPHCRRSHAQGLLGSRPWPGYLVGGPNSHNDPNSFPPGESCPVSNQPATCYFDFYGDYARNEIAINWNSAFIYALAAMQPGAEAFRINSCYPGQPECDPSSIRQNAATRRTARTPNASITRTVRLRNNRLDIPPGASVYTLNGRLVAKRGLNDVTMPSVKGNGVYIIKVDNQLINNNK